MNSENTNPVVSVILPTHNRRNYLAESVDSVLRQTFENFELIVVDDASDDETPAFLDGLAKRDGRVRVIRTNENLGCNGARNLALERVRGSYVALIDDDDLALPERLERTVEGFSSSPNVDVVCTGYRFVDADGLELPWAAPVAFDQPLTDGAAAFERLYCDWAWLPTCALAMRAELFEKHRFPQIRRSDGDSTLYNQLAASGATFLLLPDVLASVRRDDRYAFMSRDRERLFVARRETLRYLARWLRSEGIAGFDHLHGVAWSRHFLKEAEFLSRGARAGAGGQGATASAGRRGGVGVRVRKHPRGLRRRRARAVFRTPRSVSTRFCARIFSRRYRAKLEVETIRFRHARVADSLP